jgi:hypothetical protein
MTSLWAVFGFFHSKGRLQLGPEVTQCQFVQGGLFCCCFYKVAAALPYHCNCVWSVPPTARWCNSVLNTALIPTRLAKQYTMALLWEVGLSPHLHSQPLYLTPSLLSDSSAPLGSWFLTPAGLRTSLCSLFHLSLWEFISLPHPFLRGRISIPPHPHSQCLITNPFLCFSVLFGGSSICPGVVLDYVLRGRVGESLAVHVAHLLGLQVMQKALKPDGGENSHDNLLKANTYWDWFPSSGV